MTSRWHSLAGVAFLALALTSFTFVAGGCPTSALSGLLDSLIADATTTGSSGGTSGGSTTGAGDTTSDGTGDADGSDDPTGGDDSDTGGSTDGAGGTSGDGSTDDVTGSDDAETVDGYTVAAIIHRGAGGFAADPKYGIPADAPYATSGSIQSAVRIPRVSKDGNRIWFATQDGNGFVAPQLFCMNADGSGLQQIPLPTSDINRVPVELWPSADGQVCALLIDTGLGTDFSQSTIQIADRRTGLVTLLWDGRNLTDGNDDYDDVQITDDGSTIYFKEINTSIIYRISAGGGVPSGVTLPGDYPRTNCTPYEIRHFRINGDASALVANVWFYGPNSSYPADVYLKTATGVEAITTTGDTRISVGDEYLGVSDDRRYVAYRRFFSSASRYGAYVLDRQAGQTTELPTGAGSWPTILDSAGTVIFSAFAVDNPNGGVDQLPGLATLDAGSRLEVLEAWAGNSSHPPYITSMSAGGDVLVGTWANGAFGDPTRLYAWFPNATSYRSGPQIDAVSYHYDTVASTLTVRARVSGGSEISAVRLNGMYRNFESVYQLDDSADPFYDVRWGGELTAIDTAGLYATTIALDGIALDGDYRVRITVCDNAAKDFAYVDFRPVPTTGETVDVNGDGLAD
jgi:hypothetical protein